MATRPVHPSRIIEHFEPHRSGAISAVSTATDPERLVNTHDCFCGQQCGIRLKNSDNQVIRFEPWEDFPLNRGVLCPKGVKRYLQGSHPDRLLTALRRDPSAPGGFRPVSYQDGLAEAVAQIRRQPEDRMKLRFTREEKMTIVHGVLCVVLVLVVLQLWLLTATMHAHLGGDEAVAWSAALASGVVPALNAGLLGHVTRMDRS